MTGSRNPESLKAVVIVPKTSSHPECLQGLLPELRKDPKIAFSEPERFEEVTARIKEAGFGLVLYSVGNKDELSEILAFLSAQAERIRQGKVRVLVFPRIDHPKLPSLLHARGCSDLLESSLARKALVHKISQAWRLVQARLQQPEPTSFVRKALPTASAQPTGEGSTPLPIGAAFDVPVIRTWVNGRNPGRVVEFGERTLSLEAPRESLKVGEPGRFRFIASGSLPKACCEISGRVASVSGVGASSVFKIDLDDGAAREVTKVSALLTARQEELQRFFQDAKGATDSGETPPAVDWQARGPFVAADPDPASRARTVGWLAQIGVEAALISTAANAGEAAEAIARRKPGIVIAELSLGKPALLELKRTQAEADPSRKGVVFAVGALNASRSSVAWAAENGADCLILRPCGADAFKQLLIQALRETASATPYAQAIQAGCSALDAGEIPAALDAFAKARDLDQRPSLACYYLAQAELRRNAHVAAKWELERGLSYNRIHHKCLEALYELLREHGTELEAYRVIKKLVEAYPANPTRLTEALRLAVATASFGDIEGFHRIVGLLDERSDRLVDHACAALAVAGKHFLRAKIEARALQIFEDVMATSGGKPKFLDFVVSALEESGLAGEAERFRNTF